ncbi:hypothetical protein BWI17_07650 [Betaproteobacteria bacterium GR16-43]|nr:hypothetical protein BWI17_07650 [Betaproteobacteria bacterium GR16-43]
MARRYKAAKDLREFYDKALAAGGMANVWYALSALARCSEVGRLGIVGMEQRFASYGGEDPSDPIRRDVWRQWMEPCRAFETRPAPAGEMQRVIAKLKETPGLVAEGFRRFGENVPPEEQRAFERAIVDSNEGDLIFSFGTTHVLRAPVKNYASVEEAQAASRASTLELHAWGLATCELGRDCTRGSDAWVNVCFVSGDCSDNNAEALATKTLGAEALPQVRARKDEVVAAIKARNWTALGL